MRFGLYQPLRTAQEEQILHAAKQQSSLLETVRGIQSVKLFNRGLQRRTVYQNRLADNFNAGIRIQQLGIWFRALNRGVFCIENVAVVWVGALLVLDSALSVGMLFAFLAYKQQFITRVVGLIDKAIELKMLGLHAERVADIALTSAETGQGDITLGHSAANEHRAATAFASVTPNPIRSILNNLSLRIEEGESVAIIGPSGCGKTTLVKVLLGLLPATDGEVLIGGVSMNALGSNRLRDIVGSVMQDDQLFAGSIAENICFFDPEPDQARIEQCARIAAVHAEIAAMPMAYNTLVGDMGAALSGGQKQRILLARALYKQPRILVLDEATSHLDVARERAINEAIRALRITRVIIAHRPETIASADRVIRLGPGAVQSLGTVPSRPASDNRQTPALA